MKRLLCTLTVLLLAASAPLRASDVELAPNAKFTLDFPELPQTYDEQKTGHKTAPMLSAELPENYAVGKSFPLFVFINGGSGGTGGSASFARTVIGPRDFIAVNLPLFKDANAKPPTLSGTSLNLSELINPNDASVLGSSYRVMLARLAQKIPNIALERSTLGGFSNGAHATSVLAAAKDEFILKHFTAFAMLEGGLGFALNPKAFQEPEMKGHRFIILFGDRDKDPQQQAQRTLVGGPMLQVIEQHATAAHLDFTHVVMHGYGHDQPPEYLKIIGAWARGETLPEMK